MAVSFQGFRSLVENSPDAISVIDRRGAILYGSASTTKILGYHPEELVGRNCLELIHPEDREHSSQALHDVAGQATFSTPMGCPGPSQERQLPLGGEHAFQLAVRSRSTGDRGAAAGYQCAESRGTREERARRGIGSLQLAAGGVCVHRGARFGSPSGQFPCIQKCLPKIRKWTRMPSKWPKLYSPARLACPL